MDSKKRTEYLICTVSVLVAGFIIYGSIACFGKPPLYDDRIKAFLLFGMLGGFGFSMLLSGCILFVRFIAKRSLLFKTVASVFFIVSFAAIVYVGVLTYFPYQIYNLVQIVKDKKALKKE